MKIKKYLAENKDISKTLLFSIAMAAMLAILVSCFVLNRVIERHDEELLKFIAADVYDDIYNDLLKPAMVARVMANDANIKEQLRDEKNISHEEMIRLMKTYLATVKNNFGLSSAFIISDTSKNYYSYEGFNKKIDVQKNSHDIWYKNFVDQNTDYDFDIDSDEINKDAWTVFVNARIADDDGELLGVCGVGVDLSSLQNVFITSEVTYNIKINLTDENGIIQVDTDYVNIENSRVENVLNFNKPTQFVLSKNEDVYTITKYMPDFDWYLVVRRDADESKNDFSNLIIYISLSFFIASVILLIFIQVILKIYRRQVEDAAKKLGLASYAGLYISMHLIDVKNDTIHELSHDPNVNLLLVHDGGNAAQKIQKAVSEMTAPENFQVMKNFVNFDTLLERMQKDHVINCEFLSNKCGWCKAYFLAADYDNNNDINQVILAIELIDEEKRREKHLLYLSETDTMTGLRNRGSGEKAIIDLMAKGKEGMFCLLDADKFKSVNDNFGHEVGDKVIRAIADCLKKSFRNSDITLRLGGDEFAAYAIGITDEEHGKTVVKRLFDEIDRINIPELGKRKITVSLGSAIFNPVEQCSFEELYKRADAAAYESKKFSGNYHTAHKNKNFGDDEVK